MKIYIFAILLLLAGICFFGLYRVVNYDDPDGPLFAGTYADDIPRFRSQLTVVTYNLHFSEDLEGIIADLLQIPEPDVVLLQEADEVGVGQISEVLGMNYIYYPSSVHRHGHNFGNGILASWPLLKPEKIILPHENPRNGQLRIAVKALIDLGDYQINVYSVHFETLWLSSEKRMEQIQAQIDSIDQEVEMVIVGGDFNTVSSRGIRAVEARYKAVGFSRSTSGLGSTTNTPFVGFEMDHIFSRGFSVLSADVLTQSAGSDHRPVWVQFKLIGSE